MAGLLDKKDEDRTDGEIDTAGMADISFLLLIFFLITTTFDTDTGIGMTLPPKLKDNQEPPPVKDRNMLKVLVNSKGDVLIEEKPSSVNQVRKEVKKHVQNNGSNPDYAVNADKAVVSIKTAQQTPYDKYIDVLDEAWLAYFQMWDVAAQQRGYDDYDAFKNENPTDPGQKNAIRKKLPAQISIAEPGRGAGGGSG